MNGHILNSLAQQRLEDFLKAPVHGLMLVGPTGSGKRTLALGVAEQVLDLQGGNFASHPYALLVESLEGKAIGIESVRKLEQFMALKVPGSRPYDRVVVIENAHLMTLEAQNALLKMLEEPPEGTVLILTANHEQTVLPTIRSRVRSIPLGRPERETLEKHFAGQGFDAQAIKQAYNISGGLPGLMSALLNESDHPLLQATEYARKLLSQTSFERLATVDELAKQRTLAVDITVILQQMAHLSLQSASGPAARKWHRVLTASYEASEALASSAQPKLALTKLMLEL